MIALVDPEGTGKFGEEGLRIVMEDKLKEEHTVEDMMGFLKLLDKNDDGEIPTPEFK